MSFTVLRHFVSMLNDDYRTWVFLRQCEHMQVDDFIDFFDQSDHLGCKCTLKIS